MKDIRKQLESKIMIPQMRGEYIFDNSISDIVNGPLFIEEWNSSYKNFINNLLSNAEELKNNVIKSIHRYISNLKYCRKIYCMYDANNEIKHTINFIESVLIENLDSLVAILINQ